MSVLIICEKPSVAKTVALALGAAEQKGSFGNHSDKWFLV